MATTLRKLYETHDGKVSDKWYLYLEEYERLLSPLRNEKVNLLEIGVQNGGSLEIGNKYFPNATKLIGCDVNPDCKQLKFSEEKIEVVIGDANENTVYEDIISKSSAYDVIIDDGSHVSSDIIKNYIKYFPLVSDGGIYIIEDLHCSYWKNYEGGLYNLTSSLAFLKQLVDIINRNHWDVKERLNTVFMPFESQYGITLSDFGMEHIRSIEFFDSVCVIKKKALADNSLGKRVVAGKVAEIRNEVLAVKNSYLTPPAIEGISIGDNPYLEIKTLKEKLKNDEKRHCAVMSGKDKRIKELENFNNNILNSKSWRVTSPFRFMADKIRNRLG